MKLNLIKKELKKAICLAMATVMVVGCVPQKAMATEISDEVFEVDEQESVNEERESEEENVEEEASLTEENIDGENIDGENDLAEKNTTEEDKNEYGRTRDNADSLTLFWTASGFECNVSGSELWVEIEVTYDNFEPWCSYTLNGNWIGRQMLPRGRYWLPLFRGMSKESIKNVRFFKDLQAMSDDSNSLIHIHSFRFDGKFYAVKNRKYKLEFIGDSITSGEGLFGAKQETEWLPMFFSALKSYTYLVYEVVE